MKFTIARKPLLAAASMAARFTNRTASLPILTTICLTPSANTLTVRATDLAHCFETTVPFTTDDDGSDFAPFCVSASKLSQIVAGFDGDSVTMETTATDRIRMPFFCTLTCGSDVFTLPTMAGDEFPSAPTVDPVASFCASGKVFREIIKRTAFSMADDWTRPVIQSLLLRIADGKLTAVATDAHRLAVYTSNAVLSVSGECDGLLTASAVSHLSRVVKTDDGVYISFNNGNAKVLICPMKDGTPVTIITRLVDGVFPNYRAVVPTTHTIRLTIETKTFLASVRRAAVVARDECNRVELTASGFHLSVSATAGESAYKSSFEIAKDGDDIVAAFNCKYLADVLGAMGTTGVSMELTEPLRPAVLRPIGDESGDYLCVLMPMQVL